MFKTFWGTYRYLHMPFGLCNAPATFQRALEIILDHVRWQVCLVYLDDVIVFSENVDDHGRHLDTVLSLLHDACITLRLRKCFFFQPRLEYLGHVISPGKLAVSSTHIDEFRNFELLRSRRELREFLGAYNVCRRFIKSFAAIARPLNCFTQEDAGPDWEGPTQEQLEAFETLKKKMMSAPVLAYHARARRTCSTRTHRHTNLDVRYSKNRMTTPGSPLTTGATHSTSPTGTTPQRSANATP